MGLGVWHWCHIVFAWLLSDDSTSWGGLEKPKTVAVPGDPSGTFRHPHPYSFLPLEAGLKLIRSSGGASIPRWWRVHRCCLRRWWQLAPAEMDTTRYQGARSTTTWNRTRQCRWMRNFG